MRHIATTATAAATALVLALSGCGGSSSTDAKPEQTGRSSSPSAPTKDLKAMKDLADAFQKTTGTSFKFELKSSDGTQPGVYDAESKGLSTKGTVDGENYEMIFIGSDLYMKGFPPPYDKKWVHINLSQGGAKGAPDAADPLAPLALLGAVSTVEQTGDRQYKGTLDLTKAAASGDEKARSAADALVKKLGDRARNVPFEVTLDAEGRVTRYQVDLPADGGKTETMEITASDFGADVEVAEPAASETIELKDVFK